MVELSGSVFDNQGTAINGAAISVFNRNTVACAVTTTTTNACGFWTRSAIAEGRYDIQITCGSSVSRIKYDDEVQFIELETAVFKIRNPADTFVYDILPAAIGANRTLTLPLITGTDTLAVLGLAQTFTTEQTYCSDSIFAGGAVRWSSGVAAVAGEYSIQRDADATNQMHLNVPTGAGFEWSVNDVAQMRLSASDLNLSCNTLSNIGASGTDFTCTGGLNLAGDLRVDGGCIGLCGDTNLLGLAANAFTVRGSLQAGCPTGPSGNGDFSISGCADIEGVMSLGNGEALNLNRSLIVDRNFSTSGAGGQIQFGGVMTATGGTSSQHLMTNLNHGIVINSGGTHAFATTLALSEPNITETSGSVTTAVTLLITDAPTEGCNNYALFVDAGASRFDGLLEIRSGQCIKIGGITARSCTEPTNALTLFNGTVPVGTLVNGATIYTKDVSCSAELHVMDEAGNETLLSPHDPASGEWIFDSRSSVTGKGIHVRMEEMMKRLCDEFGWGLVTEYPGNCC